MEFKRKAQTQIAEGILANINKGTEEDAAGGVGGEKAVQDKQSDPQNQSCYREKNSSGRSYLNRSKTEKTCEMLPNLIKKGVSLPL